MKKAYDLSENRQGLWQKSKRPWKIKDKALKMAEVIPLRGMIPVKKPNIISKPRLRCLLS
jgi:hypothetical protein